MCYFTLLAIPEGLHGKLTPKLYRWPDEDDVFRRICRPWGGEIWSDGPIHAYSTCRDCGCGTFNEERSPPTEAEIAEELAALTKKCRRKGWSWAKTQRALEGREAALRRQPHERGGLSEDTADLVAAVAEELGETAVMAVWCKSGERKRVAPGAVVTAAQLRAGDLNMDLDEVVRVLRDDSPLARQLHRPRQVTAEKVDRSP